MNNQSHSRTKILLFLAFATLLTLAPTAFADPEPLEFNPDDNQIVKPEYIKNAKQVVLLAGNDIQQASIPAAANLSRAPQRSTINVNFNPPSCGSNVQPWPADARNAFEFATDIWSSFVGSQVAIEVDACWADLPSGVLGAAGPLGFWRDFDGAPGAGIWFPNALANALAGRDLDQNTSDIRATFAASGIDWYFPTDGNVGADQYDFATVILHEIGHGLGFSGSMQVSNGQAGWGFGETTLYPIGYDFFTVNSSSQRLIDTSAFPNPSAQLLQQLQSGSLFFLGENAIRANGGAAVPIYAPPSWVQGTSYSHLDLSYSTTSDALMIGFLSRGTSIHNVGPVSKGLLHDVGWAYTRAEISAGDITSTVYLPFVAR